MKIDAKKIQDLARDDVLAGSLFDYLAKKQRHTKELTVDLAIQQVPGAMRSEMVQVFRELQQIGLGSLLMGRKGKKTRLSWLVQPADIEKARKKEIAELIASGSDSVSNEEFEQDDEDAELLTHEYRLRRDLVVSIKLPEDLTAKEASRLSQWLVTIPYDE